jgi:hypothetical protein
VTASPDGSRRLADGLLIEASVVARLLGLRLLEVDAAVVVAPAETREVALATSRVRSQPVGAALAAAERCIDEGAATLAAASP